MGAPSKIKFSSVLLFSFFLAHPALSQTPSGEKDDFIEEIQEMRQEMLNEISRNQALLKQSKANERYELRHDPMIQKLYEGERNGEYLIHLLIPDLEKGSFKAEAREGQLLLSGEIRQKNRLPQGGLSLEAQAFHRVLPLPPGVYYQEMKMEQRGPRVTLFFPKVPSQRKKEAPQIKEKLPVI